LRSIPSELPLELAEAIERVRPRLGRLASSILFFPMVGSTNDVASDLALREEGEGAVVIADGQTAGRGRRGRTWFSPAGSGIYVSVIVAPGRARTSPDRATALVTLAAGVGLAEAIEAATGLRADIKWPNDLHVGRRKLAGILADGIVARRPTAGRPPIARVVLGYGVNVGSAAYPPELQDRATSLEAELGRSVDRAALCAETLASVAARYDDLLEGRFDAILDAWRDRAPARRRARVTWDTPAGPRSGVTEDVDDSGALLVRTDDGVERIVAGEVRWG
jgi:BirA family biotin operon repressor/biotin-[acetyl-CoA-carboxylase] ligase